MSFQHRYVEMLGGRGLHIGSLVVCTYRVPSRNQWWTAPFWVGVVQDVDETPIDKMGNSEARYCAVYDRVKIQYLGTESFCGFSQIDDLAHILPLHWSDGLQHSPYFSDSRHAEMVEFASKCGLADYYKRADYACTFCLDAGCPNCEPCGEPIHSAAVWIAA